MGGILLLTSSQKQHERLFRRRKPHLINFFHADVVKKTAGKIPRHEGLLKKKTALKPTTPSNVTFHYLVYALLHAVSVQLLADVTRVWWGKVPQVTVLKILQTSGNSTRPISARWSPSIPTCRGGTSRWRCSGTR